MGCEQKSTTMPAIHTKSVKQKRSLLLNPDSSPGTMPGYGGFCPQYRYQIGETFGRTTNRLLSDGSISRSTRRLGGSTNTQRPFTVPETSGEKMKLLRKCDRKLVGSMVPGYAGFIPKSQHYFGKRYALNCVDAITDFEFDQSRHNQKIQDMRIIEAYQTGKLEQQKGLPMISSKYKTPLRAVAKEAKPFVSASLPPYPMSPYDMKNSNPEKRFVSGYGGFVPCSRGLIGQGYPLITHKALAEFTDEGIRQKESRQKPVQIHRKEVIRIGSRLIYSVDSGLVPHYTGHIPGKKFRYGGTFGFTTKDTLHRARPSTVAASL